MLTFDTIIDSLCANLADTLKKKNHDYGDSFFRQIKKHGDIAGLLRLEEKIDRYENLINSEAQVAESTLDTLMDTAGYSLLIIAAHKRLEQE